MTEVELIEEMNRRFDKITKPGMSYDSYLREAILVMFEVAAEQLAKKD